MKEFESEIMEDRAVIHLFGMIDTTNAQPIEQGILKQLEGQTGKSLVLDAEKLKYITSAGLRMILKLRKQFKDLKIIQVSPEVYEILEMTGFTTMMSVEKAYRVLSLEEAVKIGEGANGSVYRINPDTVVKVYHNKDALNEIQKEREAAKKAMILGIPTAISYDVVKVGDTYGAVFELLKAPSIAGILAAEPEKLDWCVHEFVGLLNKFHNTKAPENYLPDMKKTVLGWAGYLKGYLPSEAYEKLIQLIQQVPKDLHLIHGDYHPKNTRLMEGELLSIDMDTLSVGYPIFELGSIFMALVGFSEYDPEVALSFLGFDRSLAAAFWKKTLEEYLGTKDPAKIKEVEDKARILAYTRLVRRSLRRELDKKSSLGKREVEGWTGKLIELLAEVDTLVFTKNVLELEAINENLGEVTGFVESKLDETACSIKARMQILMAVEEIFVNIANYAYAPGHGDATVKVEVSEDPLMVTITFMDHGKPYDPLSKEDPDVGLSAEERQIGGLGIFMVKQTMDELSYEYIEGKNILTLKKNL